MFIHVDKPWDDFSRFGISIQSKKKKSIQETRIPKLRADLGCVLVTQAKPKPAFIGLNMDNFRYGLISFLTNLDLQTKPKLNCIIIQFSSLIQLKYMYFSYVSCIMDTTTFPRTFFRCL